MSAIPDPDGWDGPPRRCVDCQKMLSYEAEQHSLERFGHQDRCCECYERRQRGEKP